jgi:amino acid adenylation domain-containing protein
VSAGGLLARLLAEGVTLARDGSRIRARAPEGRLTAALRAEIAANRDAILAELDGFAHRTNAMQRAIWLACREDPGSVAYNAGFALRLSGALDAAALDAALRGLADRHPVLAERYEEAGGVPERRPCAPPALALHEGAGAGGAEAQAMAAALLAAPHDLAAGPPLRATLLRLGAVEHLLVVAVHHIACDGLSLGILLRDLEALYAAARGGAAPPTPGAEPFDAAVMREALADHAAAEAHWRRDLDGLAPPAALPFAPDAPGAPAPIRFVLPATEAAALRRAALAAGVTPFAMLAGSLALLLGRHAEREDVALAIPVHRREAAGEAETVGCLVNTLVLRADLSGDPGFDALARRVAARFRAAQAHGAMPFGELVARLNPPRGPGRPAFANAALAWQGTAPIAPFLLPGLSPAPRHFADLVATPLALPQQLGQFPLLVEAFEEPGGGIAGLAKTDGRALDAAGAARLMAQWMALLGSAAATPDAPLSTLDALPEAERAELAAWNATEAPGFGLDPVAGFRAAATAHPDAVAVETWDGLTWTYAELAVRAEALAGGLRARGVGPGVRVALLVERSHELPLAVMGTLLAGGCYVPLDAAYPAQRLRFMLEDAAPALLLTLDRHTGLVEGWDGTVLRLDADWAEIVAQQAAGPAAGPDDPAYLIYTSGTTGRPKGAANPFGAIANRLGWGQRALPIGPGDAVLQKTSCAFDVSVPEFLAPLATGAKLVLAAPGRQGDPAHLAEVILSRGVTSAHFVPSMLRAFLDHPAAARCRGRLRHLFCSGETLPPDMPARAVAVLGIAPWNGYGPTETTVEVTARRCTGEETGPLPIGAPFPNVRIHVADRALRPVAVGMPGELLIGGVQIAQGYLNRPELTAERFIRVPGLDPGLLYRSGDLGRWRPDGMLDIIGRRDTQVKLRGQRIELEEIEAGLRGHPALLDAACAVRKERLVAFVVPRPGHVAPDLAALRAHLAPMLPEGMLPASAVALPTLPLSTNGKLDRARLPEEVADAAPAIAPPRAGLEERLAEIWRELLDLAGPVGRDQGFFDLGGHSLLLARLQAAIQQRLGRAVPLADLLAHPTIARQAALLGAAAPDAVAVPRPVLPAAEPIAICGFALRVPGAAAPEVFWQRLMAGGDALARLTRAELLAEGVPPALADDPTYVPVRGVLPDIDRFDASFFGYSPREAEVMDPQQRLLLEVAWEALERAGLPPGPGIGVFAGVSLNTWLGHVLPPGPIALDPAAPGAYQAFIANDKDFAASRIAYKLGLTGPAVTVQNACSTGLVALHQAVNALRQGDCRAALVGTAAVLVPHRVGYRHQPGMIASPDGLCRAFDAGANGTAFGSGVAAFVLLPLSAAEAAGLPVLAVIRGSAVNNDGAAKPGYTAPSVDGQAEAIAAALARAGLAPDEIHYVEAHGTGTPLGDAVEVAALNRAYRGARRILLGALKPAIGHMDVTAGLGGLAKAVLALRHGQVPPTAHFTAPHPELPFAAGPFRVSGRAERLPEEGPRRAAVSAFGIGGTNAHVVLEEAPPAAPVPAALPEERLLPLSARAPEALSDLARAWAARLGAARGAAEWAGLAHAAATRRAVHPRRLFAVAGSAEDAAVQLAALVEGAAAPGTGRGEAFRARSLVFVCPGQGGQWAGMARDLLAERPAFLAALTEADAAIRSETGGWSVLSALAAGREIEGIARIQPAIFAVTLGLAAQWRDWGVRPGAVIGHSMGEVAAAHLAGALSLADAARVICRRSALLARLAGQGAMAVAELAAGEAERLAAARGIAVAAVNGPRSVVLSGRRAAVEAAVAAVSAAGGFARLVRVDVGSHSAEVESLRDSLAEALDGLGWSAPHTPWLSTVTLAPMGEDPGPGYWWRNLRQPVRFAEAVARLAAEGHGAFLELGPHPVLLPDLEAELGGRAVAAGSTRRGQGWRRPMLETAGALWAQGVELDLGAIAGPPRPAPENLPTYPFRDERHWIRRAPAAPATARLLGPEGGLPDEPELRVFPLDTAAQGFLAEHRVLGRPVLPLAALLAALATAGVREVGETVLAEPLPLDGRPAQLMLRSDEARLVAREGRPWREHARLRLAAPAAAAAPSLSAPKGLGKPGAALHAAAAARGLDFGPAFQGMVEYWEPAADRILARLALPEAAGTPEGWKLHPALLDAALQAAGLLGAGIPAGLEGFRLSPAAEGAAAGWSLARRRADGALDVTLFGLRGEVLAEVAGLRLAALPERPALPPLLVPVARPGVLPAPRPLRIQLAGEVPTPFTAALREAGAEITAEAPDAVLAWAWPEPAPPLGLLALAQRLAALSRPPRLRVAGQGAGAAGLLRGLAHEHPALDPAWLELPARPDAALWAAAAAWVTAMPSGEDHAAFDAASATTPQLRRLAPLPPPSPPPRGWRAEGTWLVTGGFGALGLAVAQRLAERGAARIVLAGPRPAPETRLAAIRAAGAEVLAEALDVADEAALGALFERLGGPLAGVVHAAGVLRDAALADMTPARLEAVWRPKVAGARLLDTLTRAAPPPVFLLFSSAVGLLGAPGQANHCAASAALDALAVGRRRAGLPALSLAWGPWEGIGAAEGRAESAARRGIGGITVEEGLHLLEAVIAAPPFSLPPVLVPLRLDLAEWRAGHAGVAGSRLLEELGAQPSAQPGGLAARLAAAPAAERPALLSRAVAAAVGQVLRLPPGRIAPEEPFGHLGLTSLLGLEIRNRLERETGLNLPATLVWAQPSLAALTAHLAARLGLAEVAEDAATAEARALGPEAARRALEAELAALEAGHD